MEETFRILGYVEARKQYHPEQDKKKRVRALRPSGFMSKSLTKAQMNWTVWKKELLSGVEGVGHFDPIIRGFPVRIMTDHLNSSLMQTKLKQPDKVLAWC